MEDRVGSNYKKIKSEIINQKQDASVWYFMQNPIIIVQISGGGQRTG